jgi:hypothetical protein
MSDQTEVNDESCAEGQSRLNVGLGELVWKPDTGIWASGHVCYAGKWHVGSVSYVSGSKGDTAHQGAFMKLPGLKAQLGVFETEEEARKRVEQAARYWIAKLNTPNVELTGSALLRSPS